MPGKVMLFLLTLVSATALLLTPAQAAREFPDSAFSVSNDAFLNYFDHRGGVKVLGVPISREFDLLGSRVQLFQRAALQQSPDGRVSLMNILDSGLLPMNRVNGSTIPGPDPDIVRSAPLPGQPEYAEKALEFVKANAPDGWEGLQTNFYTLFSNTVFMDEAFPNGDGNPGLLNLINLEVWGLPTSKPTLDSANGYVYLRFQQGIMLFDKASGRTEVVALGGYLKAVATGQNLPSDLTQDIQASKLYMQYNNAVPNGLNRPNDLPGTNLFAAFEPSAVVVPTPMPTPIPPTATPVPPTATPLPPTPTPGRPSEVEIIGSEWFVSGTNSALGMDPDWVRDFVWKVEEVHGVSRTDFANHTLYVSEDLAFPYDLRSNPEGQIQWYAGLIAHNATHIEQYAGGRPYQGPVAEREAQDRQKTLIYAIDSTDESRFSNRMARVLSDPSVTFSCWQSAP